MSLTASRPSLQRWVRQIWRPSTVAPLTSAHRCRLSLRAADSWTQVGLPSLPLSALFPHTGLSNILLSPIAELKELNSSLTTEEIISEIQELKEGCSGYRERLEKIKSATNHVTPEQKEMVWVTIRPGFKYKTRFFHILVLMRLSFRFTRRDISTWKSGRRGRDWWFIYFRALFQLYCWSVMDLHDKM